MEPHECPREGHGVKTKVQGAGSGTEMCDKKKEHCTAGKGADNWQGAARVVENLGLGPLLYVLQNRDHADTALAKAGSLFQNTPVNHCKCRRGEEDAKRKGKTVLELNLSEYKDRGRKAEGW